MLKFSYTINAYYHWSCEYESPLGKVYPIHYVIKFVRDLRQDDGFLRGTLVSSTNKTDRHDIIEILLKVALNSLTLDVLKWYILADCVMKRIHLNNSTSMSFDSPGITHTGVTYFLGNTKSYNWDNLKQTLIQDNQKWIRKVFKLTKHQHSL